jgi:hypothetical protein
MKDLGLVAHILIQREQETERSLDNDSWYLDREIQVVGPVSVPSLASLISTARFISGVKRVPSSLKFLIFTWVIKGNF